ncbi:MAG: hypothetical protein Q7S99_16530 [Parvibaculum sp.]|nr:hypothetical protein [Parvibaculum sp.]
MMFRIGITIAVGLLMATPVLADGVGATVKSVTNNAVSAIGGMPGGARAGASASVGAGGVGVSAGANLSGLSNFTPGGPPNGGGPGQVPSDRDFYVSANSDSSLGYSVHISHKLFSF